MHDGRMDASSARRRGRLGLDMRTGAGTLAAGRAGRGRGLAPNAGDFEKIVHTYLGKALTGKSLYI